MEDEKRPKPRQLELDDAVAENERGIRELLDELRAHVRSIAQEMHRLSPYRWAQATEATVHVARIRLAKRRCVETDEILAGGLCWTLAQWRNALRDAKLVGTVLAQRTYIDGVRGPDDLTVDRTRIEQLATLSRDWIQLNPSRFNSIQVDPTESNSTQRSAQDARALRNSPKGNSESTNSNSSPTPEAPSTTSERAALEARSGASADWGQVVGEVFQAGVNAARVAVDRVRDMGATPDDVRALVAWWAPRADVDNPGQGAWDYPERVLYLRLMRWAPGQRVDAKWPPPRAGWRDPAESLRAAESLAARRQADAAAEALRKQAAVAIADEDSRLESELGAILDRIPAKERLAMLAGNPVWLREWRAGDKTGVVRKELLRRLARRGGHA